MTTDLPQPHLTKVFCFFFLKKKRFLPLSGPALALPLHQTPRGD
jgi:hypothetical protein